MRVEPRILPASYAFCGHKGCFFIWGRNMGAYFRFWKHCFDFRGLTSRRDYCTSVIYFLLCGNFIRFLEMIFLLFVFDVAAQQASQGFLFTIYACAGFLALLSMSVRRLRDGGYLDRTAWKFFIPILGLIRLMWCLYKEDSR